MEENEVLEQDTELSDELAGAFDSEWDDDFTSDEGSESDDGPVEDTEPEEREEGQPDADHNSDAEEAAETSEEPGTETETGNQRFKIKYNGNEEEYDLDQMTTLAQKGRDYDHVREERDGMKGKYGKYEGFLQKLADKAGVSIDEQIDLTEAMWLMDEEAEKGNSLTEAEALLRVQRNRNAAPEQKEEMRTRVGIVQHRQLEITETLLPQHIADQIEQRTDENAAREAFQQNGYLPLYVDEKVMGIVYNTLTVQLLLDRFNLIFEGVFEPMDQSTVTSVMSNVLAPYWKQHGQSILFTLEETEKAAAKE